MLRLTFCAVLAAAAPSARADMGELRPLDSLVPDRVMAACFGRPSPELLNAPPGSTVDQLAGWIVTLKAMGVIPEQGRVIADIAATLPMLARRPHAIVLIDITSKRLTRDIYRLNDMQAALIVDPRGIERDLDRRVRDLLITYGDAAHGRIEEVRVGDATFHRLTDHRLPEWIEIEWGTIDGQFLVTFGHGALQAMLDTIQRRSRSLADEPWYRQAHARVHGATSGIEVFVDFERIRARLGEVVEDRPREVFHALGLESAERLLWTVGFDDRALRSEIIAKEVAGRDHFLRLTGKDVAAPEVTAIIPPEASAYAAFRLPLPEAVANARHAWLASQSPAHRERLRNGWANLQGRFDFDVDAGLISRLGDHLIFHTYPRHPLKLPMLFTIWIQHRGDRAQVGRTVDAMLAAWQQSLQDPVQTRPTVGLSPKLVRDDDGVWYLQLGLMGPALAVADDWIIISYAPEAVRQNLAYLESVRDPSQ